jgi:hypothetical protein
MVRAKEPDIILCCFKTETQNPLVEKLQSRGVGQNIFPDNPELTGFGFSSTLVNAFHPSYAINYYPISSCFKQLLVLEFTKAFALWRQSWTEEPWMKGLRDECRIKTKRKVGGKKIQHDILELFLIALYRKECQREMEPIVYQRPVGRTSHIPRCTV